MDAAELMAMVMRVRREERKATVLAFCDAVEAYLVSQGRVLTPANSPANSPGSENSETEPKTAGKAKPDRREYQRNLMRARRAKDKAERETKVVILPKRVIG